MSLSYFSFQPVFHNWCNKGYGMCYPVFNAVGDIFERTYHKVLLYMTNKFL